MKLASRVAHLTPSMTLAIAAKAKALKAEGVDICGFGAGEPDFDTPPHICEAAIQAIRDGHTHYGPVAGMPALREAIASKLAEENGLPYTPEQVMVSNGGKQTLFNAAMALLEPGDEVILPAPYWLSYPEMATLAGAESVVVPTSEANGFKLTPEQLKGAITPRSKLLILTSPSNPTGTMYAREELEAIAEIVVERDLYVISDEIYEKLVYDGATATSIGSLGAEIFARTILSSGFAKAYAMTGWRLGYLAGPLELIRATTAIQSHSTSNVCSFAQYGALAAYTSPESEPAVAKMRDTFDRRRHVMHDGLVSIPGITCVKPQGAFYLFPNISGTGLKSLAFCDRLLEEQQVAAVPGIAFGADDHIRLSYATDLETIEQGLFRLRAFMEPLV
ncbi:pyridoxal phosphate-dependent aminotransferase [Synechococcus sp. PCC 7336]|uniref:pyridoxal phosphate-dependent aminotransferase n=1 Tax=Synechococcus sp. PCC 7336 TaxID=195250 RepID=UPI000476AE19|nr:pyridoxal phosphate-dependent aminotransferase [Synechococcus sp. PCC 7336]